MFGDWLRASASVTVPDPLGEAETAWVGAGTLLNATSQSDVASDSRAAEAGRRNFRYVPSLPFCLLAAAGIYSAAV